MTSRTKESGRYVEAVLKSLDILDCFQNNPELGLKQIIDLTGMSRSRVMRLTGTLEHRGYLSYEPYTKKYSLGNRILGLGKSVETNSNFIPLVRQTLKALTGLTGESAALFVLDGLERMALAREESPWSIRYSVSEGQRIPLPAGAGGKILVAFGEEELKKKVLHPQTLNRLVKDTLVDPKKFEQELVLIREQGYATSLGERAADSWAVAAPVFDYQNNLVGALALAGPTSRFTPEKRSEVIDLVMEQGRHLSGLLGWSSNQSKAVAG